MLNIFSISIRILITISLLLCLACSGDNPLGPAGQLPEAIGWVEQESPVEGITLTAVDFIDERRGWAVGKNGVIINTRNGGANWYEQQSGTENTLRDVDFVDSRNGWAVGHNGTILYTNDGGRKWVAQFSGTTSRLEEVTFVDRQSGWAAGRSMFVLLRTTDGGDTWTEDTLSQFRMLSNLNFADGNRGRAMLDLRQVVSTTDGGSSWTVLSKPVRGYAWGMSFLDEKYGLIVSTTYETFEGRVDWYDKVFKTVDGGNNWSLVFRRPGGYSFGGKAFIMSRNDILMVSITQIERSTDGGLSWTVQYRPTNSWSIWDATFVSSDIGWAVGRDGLILHTTNGGVTPSTVSE